MTYLSSSRISLTVVAVALATTFSACAVGGNAPETPAAAGGPQVTDKSIVPATVLPGKAQKSKRVLFVSNLDGGIRFYSADIHEKTPPLLGTITTGASRPEGVWVDRKDTLYVVN